MDKLINDIKKYANNNYDCGYDIIVECWDEARYITWVKTYNVETLEQFIESYAFMIDYTNDIKSTAY